MFGTEVLSHPSTATSHASKYFAPPPTFSAAILSNYSYNIRGDSSGIEIKCVYCSGKIETIMEVRTAYH